MTNEQVEALNKMTTWEITKKYLPYLNRGEIKRETYDWLLSQACKDSPEPQNGLESGETVSDFTTHDDEVAGRTQKQKVYEFMKDGLWHTVPELIERVYGNDRLTGSRYGARFDELRKDGYEIEKEHIRGGIYKYRMKSPVEQSVLVPDGQTKVRTI